MAKILKITIKNDDVYSFVDCKNLEETLKENYAKIEVIVEDGTTDEE